MLQTTRFSQPMLKSGRLLTIACWLPPASARPPFPLQVVCCPIPDYRLNHQQPVPCAPQKPSDGPHVEHSFGDL